MRSLRYGLIAIFMLVLSVNSARAGISIGIGLPNVSIGINIPIFPELVPVPGYPVYYAPRLDANYFFYDGMYWSYWDDNWYASYWYNGPWEFVDPYDVPLFILRIPVRYYRSPPLYFRGWRRDAPPRWERHWGRKWEQRHRGWSKWDRSAAPRPAPLPVYQREYTGNRYPRGEDQRRLHNQHYRYQPREQRIRRENAPRMERGAPVPSRQRIEKGPVERRPTQQRERRERIRNEGMSAPQKRPMQREEKIRRPAPIQSPPQQRAPVMREERHQSGPVQHEDRSPGRRGREEGERGHRGDERGR